MGIEHAGRLFRTVRHLGYSQLAWRGRYLVERRLPRRAGERNKSPSPARAENVPAVPAMHRESRDPLRLFASLLAGQIELLNDSKPFDWRAPDWRLGACSRDRLWVVTLHYHQWAHALADLAAHGESQAAQVLCTLLENWLDSCRLDAPGARALAWNSFAIATRLGWWARMLSGETAQALCGRPGLVERLVESFGEQAEYLEHHIEWDLRANHLLRDAVGLAWAGRFLQGDAARRRLRVATDLAVSEVAEQVLPDGGHFERSAMYHVQAMEDILTLSLLVEHREAAQLLRAHWRRMADWLSWVCGPQNRPPLLNDAAYNGACPVDAMRMLGRQCGFDAEHAPPSGGRWLADSGLVVWHGQPWSAWFDVGPLGPDYQPGHGHADTLSLVVDYDGQPLFVDPGVCGYDDDARRQRLRSTSAHNTVCIDGCDSSEVWGIFRVGRRARPQAVQASFAADSMCASAEHDGYDHMSGTPRHSRRVEIAADGQMSIEDRVVGHGNHHVSGGWLLAPGWHVQATSDGWLVGSADARVEITIAGSRQLLLERTAAEYCPEFGLVHSAERLSWSYDGPLPLTVTTTLVGK